MHQVETDNNFYVEHIEHFQVHNERVMSCSKKRSKHKEDKGLLIDS